MYKDWSSDNKFDRPWFWMLCNEPFGYWQTGAPKTHESIVTRLMTPEYFLRQCPIYFPGFNQSEIPDKGVSSLNNKLGGWFINGTQRLLFVNG